MPASPVDAIVLSSRGLVRAALAELLRLRFGARRVADCATADQALAAAPGAQLLVCDRNGVSAVTLDRLLDRLGDTHDRLRVVCVDDSSGLAAIEEATTDAVNRPRAPAAHDSLTLLESEVMLAVAAGQRNSEIARRMRRSTKTVEKHRANVMRKLGCRNVAQLTAYAIRHGLLDGESILATPSK